MLPSIVRILFKIKLPTVLMPLGLADILNRNCAAWSAERPIKHARVRGVNSSSCKKAQFLTLKPPY